jgi:hypothetical protein
MSKSKFDKVKKELEEAYEKLKWIKKGVNIFGSARDTLDKKYYEMVEEVSYRLAKKGFTIISGGGPGCMAYANKGATKAGKRNIGLNIKLPFEQDANKYIPKDGLINFKYFYTRKVAFTISSLATVVFPGGFGTLDEMFEQLTLIQTKKIKPRAFVLVDEKYYKNLLNFINDMAKSKSISKADRELITLANDADSVVKAILDKYETKRKKKYI